MRKREVRKEKEGDRSEEGGKQLEDEQGKLKSEEKEKNPTSLALIYMVYCLLKLFHALVLFVTTVL